MACGRFQDVLPATNLVNGVQHCAYLWLQVLCVQAQEKADTDAEAAQAALDAAQEKADINEARALEAEQKLAVESAVHIEVDEKFNELEVCKAPHAPSVNVPCILL